MPKPKYQLDDFLATINQHDKDYVLTVHDMLLQDGYKLKIQSTKTYGLHIAYAQPKIKTVKGIIAYFLQQNGKLMIRINADNYASYPQVFSQLPESITTQMDKADDCIKMKDPQKCWQGCVGYDFHIRKKHYQKCLINCFLLAVDETDFPFLVELIKHESKERSLAAS